MTTLDDDAVRELLGAVIDPEVGMNICCTRRPTPRSG